MQFREIPVIVSSRYRLISSDDEAQTISTRKELQTPHWGVGHVKRPNIPFPTTYAQNKSSAFCFRLRTRLPRCLPAIVPRLRGERS
jgi:hypothetical protein